MKVKNRISIAIALTAALLMATPVLATTSYVLVGQLNPGEFEFGECGKCQLYSYDTRTGHALRIGALGGDGDSANFRYLTGSVSYDPTLRQITLIGCPDQYVSIDFSKRTFIYTISVITGNITSKVAWKSVFPKGTTGMMIGAPVSSFPFSSAAK